MRGTINNVKEPALKVTGIQLPIGRAMLGFDGQVFLKITESVIVSVHPNGNVVAFDPTGLTDSRVLLPEGTSITITT